MSLLALLLTTCQGTGPAAPTPGPTGGSNGGTNGNSGDPGGAVGRVEILRAPAEGQEFRVNDEGSLPQPAPKFRLSITTPVDVQAGYLNIELLTPGSLRCGGVLMTLSGLTANTPLTLDIPNNEIIVGPASCAYGFNCSRSQCALPVTTTRVRVLVSIDEGELARTTEDHRYTWVQASP